MARNSWQQLSIAFLLLHSAFCYVDFGTSTLPILFEPKYTVSVPRPHQLPDDVWMRYDDYHSHITAVAPSVKLLYNGSFSTSWSLHFHKQPTTTVVVGHQDLRRRGVFSGDPPVPTCRLCDANGNPTNSSSNGNGTDSGSPTCTVANYSVRDDLSIVEC